jgi:hypothetical protein
MLLKSGLSCLFILPINLGYKLASFRYLAQMDSTSANEDSDNMSESPSNTTPITKSQRIPKPKINADFLYGDDMRKPSRKSTAKRKFIEDEDSLNGVENRTPEIKQKKRSSYTSPNNNTVMEGKRVAINGEAKLIRTVGMESRSSLRSPIGCFLIPHLIECYLNV